MTNPDQNDDIEVMEELIEKGNSEYYTWLRGIFTTASGALTLLITFQKQLEGASHLWLIKCAWIFLILTILLGLHAMRGSYLPVFDMATHVFKHLGKRTRPPKSIYPPASVQYCSKAMPICFAVAIVLIGTFGLLNLG